ncbi:MAG: ComEC/Rec2 family competence protein [Mesonia hippocampi]|uniref:ComEC/Rec2 family competence protein n=1 Tax=Mesonia hippocampi TaxID=1628250 RepID=UPI003F981910
MKLLNNIVLYLSIAFVIGVFIGLQTNNASHAPIYWAAFVILLFIVAYWRSQVIFSTDYLFSSIALLCFIALGFLTSKLHSSQYKPTHYIHKNLTETAAVKLKIKEVLKESNSYQTYIAKVIETNNENATGLILLKIKKDSSPKKIIRGTQVTGVGNFSNFYPLLNPFGFDYQKHMNDKGVYKIFYTHPAHIQTTNSKKSMYSYADYFRTHLENKLEQYDFTKPQLAIIKTMLLGQKRALDKSISQQFSKAGLAHILAISGLHIGIIVMLLRVLLSPFYRFKYGRYIALSLQLFCLWAYAFVVGFSPSVSRAVVMFSCVAIGLSMNTKGRTLDMLCLSLFILLLYQPQLLLQVGFQLSYSAVISIVAFLPLIRPLFYSKFKLLQLGWDTICVSFSAQLGVFPLILYYFHQFPGLFLFSNLLIVPFLGLFIGISILVFLLALANSLPDFIADCYASFVQLLLDSVAFFGKQDFFHFTNIYFDLPMLILSFVGIISIYYFFKLRQKVFLYSSGISLLFILICVGNHQLQQYKFEQFVILHKSKNTAIFERKKRHLQYSSTDSLSYGLEGFLNQSGIKKITKVPMRSVYEINNKFLLCVDSTANYTIPNGIKIDYVLLRGSPKVNLDKLLKQLKPEQIIADGSNYTSYVKRWETTCRKKKTPFYYTREKGAWKFSW